MVRTFPRREWNTRFSSPVLYARVISNAVVSLLQNAQIRRKDRVRVGDAIDRIRNRFGADVYNNVHSKLNFFRDELLISVMTKEFNWICI